MSLECWQAQEKDPTVSTGRCGVPSDCRGGDDENDSRGKETTFACWETCCALRSLATTTTPSQTTFRIEYLSCAVTWEKDRAVVLGIRLLEPFSP